jgi:2-iminobutanoate/2-iminopropanoate deaminase
MSVPMFVPIETPEAPLPFGHYAQAIRLGNLLVTSGQLPIDPASGNLIGGDAGTLARRVLANLDAVLQAGGSRRACVLRVNVYLTDLSEGPKVNEAFAEFFGEKHRPTRTTVVVKHLPMGAAIEMDAIAWVPGAAECI